MDEDEKTFKFGDTIPVKEEHQKRLKELSRRCDASRIGMILMSEALEQHERELWDTIQHLYPETDGYNVCYSVERQEIEFLLKKPTK